MSRYYFNVSQSGGADEIGTELSSIDDAWSQAIETAGIMLKELDGSMQPGRWQMDVTDEDGKSVIRLNFDAERLA